MQITDILAQMGGLQSIARELGISEQEAARGADALTPAVLGGFKRQAQTQPSGVEGLGGLIGQLGGGSLLDEVIGSRPTNVNRGNDVLGRIFGSKDVSRAVAQNAAGQTGLNSDLLKKMLPIVAMAVTGYMAKQQGKTARGGIPKRGGAMGSLGGLLGGLLSGRRRGNAGTVQREQPEAGGGWASLLDLDRDGNPLDEITRTLR